MTLDTYNSELNVLACIMSRIEVLDEIYELKPEMFSDELLGKIYREFLISYEKGTPTTIILIQEKLEQEGLDLPRLHKIVSDLFSVSFTSIGVKGYADVVISSYKARMLNKYLSSIKITGSNYNDVVQGIENEIDRLHGQKKENEKTLSEITKKYKDSYFCEKNEPTVRLGFSKLDDMIQLEGGDMVVIGARPAVGKSAFVTQIASNLSNNAKKVGFFNLEMLDKQMFERFVVSRSNISLTRLKRAKCFLGKEKEEYSKAVDSLMNDENIVISTGRKSVSDIKRECRNANFDIVIIDYLQLVKPDKTYRGNRAAEVGEVSKSLKELAMELNIPIIALSQMNRMSEMKEDKEPTMSELREAGDIEQDASVILLLWNPDKDDKTIKGCKAEKNRQGELGKAYFRFDGDHMKFKETEYKKQKKDNNDWQKVTSDVPFWE